MSEAAEGPHGERLRRYRRYRRYPEYRDSGVEWLGEIPAHWGMKRLKNCVSRLESGGTPESDNFSYWSQDESGIPWVAISDMTRAFHVHDTDKRLTECGLRSKRLPMLSAGTLLYSMYASLGKVAVLEINAVVNQAILGIVPRPEIVAQTYLRWWLEFMRGHVQMLSSSNTQDNLNADKVRKMPVFVPDLDTQRAIAAFLDRETARIDTLVAKNERLIELLQEQRTALISRGVTKGLDPNVPMKDSGVEWLGEIPAHWEVNRIKDTTRKIGSGKTPLGGGEVYVAQGVMLLRSQNVHFGALRLDDVAFIDDETDREMSGSRVQEGDVLLNITGASLGRCCVAHLEGAAANVNQHVCILRPRGDMVDSEFLAAALASHAGQAQIFTTENGISRDALNFDQVSRIVVSVPSLAEQRLIVASMSGATTRIDALVAKVRGAIDRLKELRTALISAAVTGKIDVREETA